MAETPTIRASSRKDIASATAVYRHFPDKRALLAALAATGITRLGEVQRTASEAAGGGADGFAATGRAYVRFALAHPALFRLAFSHGEFAGSPGLGNDEAARLLRDYATQFAGADAQRLTLQAWAVAHGLAMLMLDGLLPEDDATINAVIDARTLFAGKTKEPTTGSTPPAF